MKHDQGLTMSPQEYEHHFSELDNGWVIESYGDSKGKMHGSIIKNSVTGERQQYCVIEVDEVPRVVVKQLPTRHI